MKKCLCCGGGDFKFDKVIWDKLAKEWSLGNSERNYIDRQQGLSCIDCGSNLRSITLAGIIMRKFGYQGVFKDFVKKYKKLRILEINEAGSLTQFFKPMKNHILTSYPEIDIMSLPQPNNTFDLVVHSDTLEHIVDPIIALKENLRVIKKDGFLAFTVPIVHFRKTKNRMDLKPSYHGYENNDDFLVHNEFGSDIWNFVFEAGFNEVRMFTIEYPSCVAISCFK